MSLYYIALVTGVVVVIVNATVAASRLRYLKSQPVEAESAFLESLDPEIDRRIAILVRRAFADAADVPADMIHATDSAESLRHRLCLGLTDPIEQIVPAEVAEALTRARLYSVASIPTNATVSDVSLMVTKANALGAGG